ncbi:sugar ABC transporter substrate-binding protein [Amycolatopsis pithecellobii]|uniref:Substrate-binding domain-containing protein n=1 Tax=Amycolatopsis pithecellobii TaxID=664692 RepID=A0A6N7YM29_9PSEU|nr:sugar ABC transporter substrate-binding protein [Amycolatopsis pithecellobii]MTD52908.1 substrate-binding domain-containing protein [Amycolatopsis pithecellobii]
MTVLVSACSSSDGSSNGTGPATTSGTATPGVSTMDQLYQGLGEAPPAGGPTPPKNKTIWWVSCGEKIPACSTLTAAGREAAGMLGWTFTVADGNLNANGGYQTAMRQAITAKPDAIVDSAIDCSLIEQPLKEAQAAGIPVIAALANDCDSAIGGNGGSALFSGPTKFSAGAPTAGDYITAAGTAGAAYIINKTGGHAKIIDAVIQAPLGGAIDNGFKSEIKKCADCSIVGSFTFQPADTTAGGPFGQALQAALVKNPDANVVYLALDSELQNGGGARIVKQTGRNIMVVGGQGADPAVVALAKSGDISALTSVQSPQWIGYGAMDTVVRVLAKVPTVNQGIGAIVVDAHHGIGANNTVASAPYDLKAAYSKLWGLGG